MNTLVCPLSNSDSPAYLPKLALPKDILKYEERPEWYHPQLPWHQEPSEALDAVWDDVLYCKGNCFLFFQNTC